MSRRKRQASAPPAESRPGRRAFVLAGGLLAAAALEDPITRERAQARLQALP